MQQSGISIHAPAKGATTVTPFPTLKPRISIHAPAKGATVYIFFIPFYFIYFNPRSREGSDYLETSSVNLIVDFNPRSREGSDLKATAGLLIFI